MLRKSLILGSITLLMVMLFAFTGCEGPVGPAGPAGDDGRNGITGSPGDDGKVGGFSVGGRNVTDVELAALFDSGDTVILESSVDMDALGSVYGVVPVGKVLKVVGRTRVTPGKELVVNGTLDVSNKDGRAALFATGIPGDAFPAAGALKSAAGASITSTKVKNDIPGGMYILPYIVSGSYDLGLNYDSPEFQPLVHYPGSTVINGEEPVELSSSGIRSIFTRVENPIDDLTIWYVNNLEAIAIPENKNLTLKGWATIPSPGPGFTLTDGASFTVAQDAFLYAQNADLSVDSGATITNNGTIYLGTTGSASKNAAGTFDNNWVIESGTTGGSNVILEDLLALGGTGKILLNPSLSGSTDLSVGLPNRKVLLNQNLEIAPVLFTSTDPYPYTYTVTFPNQDPLLDTKSEKDKVITLANKYAVIVLGPDTTSTGRKIVNNGRVVTQAFPSVDVVPDEVWVTLFNEMENKGKVTIASAIAELSQDLEIPEGIELTIDDPDATFKDNATGSSGDHGINVKGTLILKSVAAYPPAPSSFGPTGDITVSGTLIIMDGQTLAAQQDVTITGILNLDTGTPGTGGGTLRMDTSYILSISSTSILEKTPLDATVEGRIVIQQDTNGITIDGLAGYGVPSPGDAIFAKDFAKALKAVHDSADIIKTDLITLDPSRPFFTDPSAATVAVDVVGTVEINGLNPIDVDRDANADGSYLKKIAFPAGTTISVESSGDEGKARNPPVGNLGNPDEFHISIVPPGTPTGPWNLAVRDESYIAPTTGLVKWGIVSFEAVRFINSNLVGPAAPQTPSTSTPKWAEPFSIGIKTYR
jgi:hypothetical protein